MGNYCLMVIVSLSNDENFVEIDSGESSTAPNVLNATELYT